MDDVLGRMAEGPRFADLWEVERLYARVLQAWTNLRRRGLEHTGRAVHNYAVRELEACQAGVNPPTA